MGDFLTLQLLEAACASWLLSFLHLQNTSFSPISPSIPCRLPPPYKDPCDCMGSTGKPLPSYTPHASHPLSTTSVAPSAETLLSTYYKSSRTKE